MTATASELSWITDPALSYRLSFFLYSFSSFFNVLTLKLFFIQSTLIVFLLLLELGPDFLPSLPTQKEAPVAQADLELDIDCYVAENDLEFIILLPLLLTFWGHKHVPTKPSLPGAGDCTQDFMSVRQALS